MNQGVAIEQKIGQLLVCGFHGTKPEDQEVAQLLDFAAQGLVGGVILFRHNIESPGQVQQLTAAFRSVNSPHPLFVFVDQEGGKVQRFGSSNGFRDFPSAKQYSTEGRDREVYQELADLLAEQGINFNFAPCVDLDCDPPCVVIGGLERSYGDDPDRVAECATDMIEALHSRKILSCLKHFPGHGRASGDSHMGMTEIAKDWQENELRPYELLLEKGLVDAVMPAHVIHQEVDADTPASLSSVWIEKLRRDIGFEGLVISDDFHMGAIQQHYSFDQILSKALQAGIDQLVFSNNPAAAGGIEDFRPNSQLPLKFQEVLQDLLGSEVVHTTQIDRAFSRVIELKRALVAS